MSVEFTQLIAILTCLLAAAVLLYVRVARHPEPEDLWVNRDRKAEMLAAEADRDRDFSAALCRDLSVPLHRDIG